MNCPCLDVKVLKLLSWTLVLHEHWAWVQEESPASPCVLKKSSWYLRPEQEHCLILFMWKMVRQRAVPRVYHLQACFYQKYLGVFYGLWLLLDKQAQIKMIWHRAILTAEVAFQLQMTIQCDLPLSQAAVFTFQLCLSWVTKYLFRYSWDLLAYVCW